MPQLLLFVSRPMQITDSNESFLHCLVPTDASVAVRRFVEALFITHAETKLNTSGQLLHEEHDDTDDNSGNVYPMSAEGRIRDRGEWCRTINLHLDQ